MGEIFMYTVEAKPGARKADGSAWTATDLRTLQDWVIRHSCSTCAASPRSTPSVDSHGRSTSLPIRPGWWHWVSPARRGRGGCREQPELGAGYIERNGQQFLVRAPGQVVDLDAIRDIVLDRREGVPIRVRDVAQVGEGPELRNGAATQNGREVVLGTVFMLIGSNSRDVAQASATRLVEASKSRCRPAWSPMPSMTARVWWIAPCHGQPKNLLEGALLVIVVLFCCLAIFAPR
jgi:cobalt-zinc-cadmium resistance protein CzcA